MKRKILLLITAAMIIGNAVTSVAAVSFSDINDVPWDEAKTYINSVADLGLMVGDKNASGNTVFRAKDKVTYCETTQMAYNLLKNTNKLKSSTGTVEKWTAVMKGYKIPSWAHESVSYALDNNVVSVADISRFMKNETTNNYASREDVAVIFGKALSATNTINTSASLSFNDKSKIAATSVPYVDLLVRLNILVGDSNNNFNPRNYINRAEMAVMTVKTNSALGVSIGTPMPTPTPTPPDISVTTSEVRGTVVKFDDMGGSALMSVSINGINSGFIVDSTTYIVYINGQVNYSAISAGDNVTVNYTGAKVNKVTINFSMNNGIGSSGVKGTIDDITNERIFINKDSGGTANYYFANNISITIDKSSSSVKQLMEAFDDSTVNVELVLNGKNDVSSITATTNLRDGITGEVISIDSSEIEIRRSTGSRTTYKFASDPSIKFDGSRSTITKINTEMKDGTVYARIYLTSGSKVETLETSFDKYKTSSSSNSGNIEGEIYSIDDNKIKVKEDRNSSTKTYTLRSDSTLRLDGSTSSIREINREVEDGTVYVILTLDSSDKVSRVDASLKSSSSSKNKVTGTMTSFNDTKIRVKSSTYYWAHDVEYILEDDDSNFSKIERAFNNNDSELYVTIKLDRNGDVIYIEASKRTGNSSSNRDDTHDGEITSVSSSHIKIDGKTYDVEDDFDDDVTIKVKDGYDSSQRITTYEDLKKAMDNEKVMEVRITIKGGYLTAIEGDVIKAIGQVTKIEKSDKTIKISLPYKGSSIYKYESGVNIKINGKSKEISDLNDAINEFSVTAEKIELKNDYVTDIIVTTK